MLIPPEDLPFPPPPTIQAAQELEKISDEFRHSLALIRAHTSRGTYSQQDATNRTFVAIENFLRQIFDNPPPGFSHEERAAKKFEAWCGRNGLHPDDEMYGQAEEMQAEYHQHLENATRIKSWWDDLQWTFRTSILSQAANHSPQVLEYLLGG